MKFKSQDKQNQLIENISSVHLVVDVDIAQESHVARAVSFRVIALGQPLEFGSHDEGYQLFGRWIQNLLKSSNLNKVIVGMEPTVCGVIFNDNRLAKLTIAQHSANV